MDDEHFDRIYNAAAFAETEALDGRLESIMYRYIDDEGEPVFGFSGRSKDGLIEMLTTGLSLVSRMPPDKPADKDELLFDD